VVSFVSQLLYPWHPMNEMLKCPRGWYGPSEERKNALPLPGIETQPNQNNDYNITASRNQCTKVAVN